jgi:1-pyrroline-5-carboxylate dehydrogenase
VTQFVPGDPKLLTDTVLSRPEFAGLTFIGSTAVSKELFGKVEKATGEGRFNQYPRVVGETGGKNFHLILPSADIQSAAYNTLRATFEYQARNAQPVPEYTLPSPPGPSLRGTCRKKQQR